MTPLVSRWTAAVYAAWRDRVGTTQAAALPGPDDPRRQKFDREYDELIAEMARQLPATR